MSPSKKESLFVSNETKSKVPPLPFRRLKEKILGKNYFLGIIFVGDTKSKTLNRVYRKKNKPTNILSFALEKNEGELYINLKQAKRELKIFNRPFSNLLAFLLIHGMFHLKGEVHGSRMEAKEKAVRTLFHI